MATFNTSIVDNGDDGREGSFGWQATPGSDWIIVGNPGSSQHGGFRFTNITIPQGATISSAVITLNQAQDSGADGSANAEWFAWDTDNAAQFVNAGDMPSNVTPTTANTTYTQSATTNPTFALVDHNVTSVVQEIVNRAGWASGNSINFMALNQESVAFIFDNIDDFSTPGTPIVAALAITYSAGGSTAVPVFLNHLRTQGIA
jgi:hypothetical protein